MSNWPASEARRLLAALERIGWRVQRQRGSQRLPTRLGRDRTAHAGENRQEDRFEPKRSVMPRLPALAAASRPGPRIGRRISASRANLRVGRDTSK
jgi:hypothetical protein